MQHDMKMPMTSAAVEEIILILERTDVHHGDVHRDAVTLPWDVTPREYLEFARQDIDGTDKRGVVNALSNAKRALGCQLESLLLAFEIPKAKNSKPIPDMLDILEQLGVVTTKNLLAKINKYRNEVEHDFNCPPHERVAEFVDIVALFLEATRRYLDDRQCFWEFFDAQYRQVLSIRLESVGLQIKAGGGTASQVLGIVGAKNQSDYCRLLRAIWLAEERG